MVTCDCYLKSFWCHDIQFGFMKSFKVISGHLKKWLSFSSQVKIHNLTVFKFISTKMFGFFTKPIFDTWCHTPKMALFFHVHWKIQVFFQGIFLQKNNIRTNIFDPFSSLFKSYFLFQIINLYNTKLFNILISHNVLLLLYSK